MTLREKELYHQIHPLKLGTDITAQIVSAYFFWVHNIGIGFLTMLLPPIVVSSLMLSTMDFTWIKESAVGRYLKWSMTRGMEGLRLLGVIPITLGAWYHQPWGFVLGIAMILFGWLRGLIFPRRSDADAVPSV